MLTYEDCLALSALTEDEIAAIAEHEHIPRLAALELGDYLLHTPEGVPAIKHIILDDIRDAQAHGDRLHAIKLKLVLKHFCDCHPEAARPEARPPSG